jgi:hypothetical protein
MEFVFVCFHFGYFQTAKTIPTNSLVMFSVFFPLHERQLTICFYVTITIPLLDRHHAGPVEGDNIGKLPSPSLNTNWTESAAL